MDLTPYLREHPYVDYTAENLRQCASALFGGIDDDVEKARIAYHFVRDQIPHSFDCQAQVITARASAVLRHRTGICHAKANLLAALLRSQGVPVGFCFQHLTLLDDDSMGYCVHCYNAIYLDHRWIRVDARGNTNGISAAFSLGEPVLAFPPRSEYDEYTWDGIFATPHMATMAALDRSNCLQDVREGLPNHIDDLLQEYAADFSLP